MEFKAIIYIIGALVYFFYALNKKAQENKDKKSAPATGNVNLPQKPVSPPVAKPLREVMQQAKKLRADYETQRRRASEALKSAKQETLVNELEKRGTQEIEMEKQTSPVMIAAETKELELLHADSYKHNEEETVPYEIDPRQAFIGSIIFEQKF